jgi:hypothetical protein
MKAYEAPIVLNQSELPLFHLEWLWDGASHLSRASLGESTSVIHCTEFERC